MFLSPKPNFKKVMLRGSSLLLSSDSDSSEPSTEVYSVSLLYLWNENLRERVLLCNLSIYFALTTSLNKAVLTMP